MSSCILAQLYQTMSTHSVQVEGAEEEEDEDTLAGVSAYALRTFLRQTRELTYQAVGQVAARVPALWQATALQPAFVVSSVVQQLRATVSSDNDMLLYCMSANTMRPSAWCCACSHIIALDAYSLLAGGRDGRLGRDRPSDAAPAAAAHRHAADQARASRSEVCARTRLGSAHCDAPMLTGS